MNDIPYIGDRRENLYGVGSTSTYQVSLLTEAEQKGNLSAQGRRLAVPTYSGSLTGTCACHKPASASHKTTTYVVVRF